MTRDDLLGKVAGLACASLFDVKERLANDIDTHDASQRALIEQQAKEIARLHSLLQRAQTIITLDADIYTIWREDAGEELVK